MSKYKLLALDLDATLLDSQGRISERNIRAIKKAKGNGVHVAVFTGRSPLGASIVWENGLFYDVAACFGGAVIKNMRTNEVLHSNYLKHDLVRKSLDYATKCSLVSQIYVNDYVVSECENPYTQRYIEYLKLKCIYDNEIRNKKWTNVPKVLYFADSNELMAHLEATRNEFKDCMEVTASSKYFIELSDLNSTKGKALEWFCKHLDISPSETIAVGDSLLDLSMIKAADIGIAVKNAHPDLLNEADYVSPSCDEHAIEWVVQNFI